MDYMKKQNCNKAKCKSCIFGPNPVELSVARQNEINSYLVNMESSHICHTTNKTCYGALELQARVLFVKGIIPAPTPEAMLETASKYLN